MQRTVEFLKDFEAQANQLKETRRDVLPLIDSAAIFNHLSENGGKFIRFESFNSFVESEDGARDMFDTFVNQAEPGLTYAGFKKMLGYSDSCKDGGYLMSK